MRDVARDVDVGAREVERVRVDVVAVRILHEGLELVGVVREDRASHLDRRRVVRRRVTLGRRDLSTGLVRDAENQLARK